MEFSPIVAMSQEQRDIYHHHLSAYSIWHVVNLYGAAGGERSTASYKQIVSNVSRDLAWDAVPTEEGNKSFVLQVFGMVCCKFMRCRGV